MLLFQTKFADITDPRTGQPFGEDYRNNEQNTLDLVGKYTDKTKMLENDLWVLNWQSTTRFIMEEVQNHFINGFLSDWSASLVVSYIQIAPKVFQS